MKRDDIKRVITENRVLGKNTIVEPLAKEILGAYSVPVPNSRTVKDVTSAIEAAEEIGYPVVLKLVSPDVIHKSDVGAVRVGIEDPKDMEESWRCMVRNVMDSLPSARIEGFLVEEMVAPGIEVIVGGIRDEQFEGVVMFGMGGIFVEIMKDVSFALTPLEKGEALEMIRKIKGYPVLEGFRGESPKDIDAIADVILKVADIIEDIRDIKELEINPLMVYEKGVMAVDARARIG